MAHYNYKNLSANLENNGVLSLSLNRPRKMNAFNEELFHELKVCFEQISWDPDVRCVVFSGNGRAFCAGIDLTFLASNTTIEETDIGRKSLILTKFVRALQNSVSAIADCNKPVICVIHGACIGVGIEVVAATDIRYCTSDATFSVREGRMGLAADVGGLQRLPKIVGNDSKIRELAFTARDFRGKEAENLGLVSQVFDDQAGAMAAAMATAQEIAALSPVAMVATKKTLNYSREHSVEEGLDYIATLNGALLQSEDVPIAVAASQTKTKPTFSKL
ncbi:hypothetical protein CYMTET_33737 [Cymbomonas tetramitiformis]|uniref:Uncharacterized protein n=1 Tax=Cymbomonas tetramitiformis TaxID=36881 RepID=A0AAE0FD43_9CHLO|nr:hypothetical protein CYMTET_33737 [Cymbomonas tetramitiformis]|eukprot:gene23776-28825_t